jgi:hypothetical protein
LVVFLLEYLSQLSQRQSHSHPRISMIDHNQYNSPFPSIFFKLKSTTASFHARFA